MKKTKKKPLPLFEMRAVFEARFPHPTSTRLDEMTLRYIITASGENDEDLRESAYFYAKIKMENLGLKPLGIDLYDREYFTAKDRDTGERTQAVHWLDTPEEMAKAVKQRLYVPENKAEALELYDDATKYPNIIRSARSMLRKPGEARAAILVETMAGATFRFEPLELADSPIPKAGRDVTPWLTRLAPLNDLASALKASAVAVV